MNNTRKLSLTLCILVATLMLTLTTLGIVLVSGTQYVVTDLDIHYGGSSTVTFALSDDCTNASDFDNYTNLKIGNTIEALPTPTILNKCFTGWYLDNSGNNKIDLPYEITEAVTLYPIYLDATSDLTYSYNETTQSYALDGDSTVIRSKRDIKSNTHIKIGWFTTKYTGEETNIVIPDIVDDGINGIHPVKVISEMYFQHTSIVSVVIPASVTRIELGAFYACDELISAIFINPTGWTVTNDSTETTGEPVTISEDVSANATSLVQVYNEYYWNRA